MPGPWCAGRRLMLACVLLAGPAAPWPAVALPATPAPPLALPAGGVVVRVSTEGQLQAAVRGLRSGTTILLAPGTYRLTRTLVVSGTLTDVGIRGETRDRDAVVLLGRGMSRPDDTVPYGIWTGGAVRRITVANLTARGFYRHALIFNAGTQQPHVYNVHLVDAGEQFIKSNPGGAEGGVHRGVVEYSVIEYTTTARSDYTNGVDVHGGHAWVVRHNLFRNLQAPAGQLAGPAVLMWNQSRDTVTDGNTFINCARGISYGLIVRPGHDHVGGLIRNNVFFRANTQSGDVGIHVADSPGTQVLHNTVFVSGTYATPIEYRFVGSTGVLLANNLLDGVIAALDGASGRDVTNRTGATAELFVDAVRGDLHLVPRPGRVSDRGTPLADVRDDMDGQARPEGAGPDIGADEK